jgi:hypothetical protein
MTDKEAAGKLPPLVWSDKLAAESTIWAEHVETTGHMVHAPLPAELEGESIAGYWPGPGGHWLQKMEYMYG